MRRCPKCHPSRKHWAKNKCRACYDAEREVRYKDTRNSIRRFRMYGVTEEHFAEMMLTQNGCCAICGRTLDPPCVEHCHKTGRVRGLCCYRCNSVLGHAGDSIPVLQSAIEYLRRWCDTA